MMYAITGVIFMLYVVVYSLMKISKNTERSHRLLTTGKWGKEQKASVDNPIMLVVEGGRENVFADYTAFYGYPDYLFRSDDRQKWTTERVRVNFCIWADELEVHFLSDEFQRRKELSQHLIQKIEDLAPSQIPMPRSNKLRAFYKRVCFFNLWFMNSDFEEINVEMDAEMQALMIAMLRKLKNCEKIIPLCAVTHLDEGVSHVHFLYYMKAEYKKLPHVREILDEFLSGV